MSDGDACNYPDVMVISGELMQRGRHRDVAANPKVVVEVLSKSTVGFDKLVKIPIYQRTPPISDILFVAQDRNLVECISRAGEKWNSTVYTQLSAVVELSSINCTLALSGVYLNIRRA